MIASSDFLPGEWLAFAVRLADFVPADAEALVLAAYRAGLRLDDYQGAQQGVGRFKEGAPPTLVFGNPQTGIYTFVRRDGVDQCALVKPASKSDAPASGERA